VFHLRSVVAHFDVGKGVGSASIAHKQRVALREISRLVGRFVNLHQAAIGVIAFASRNSFGDDEDDFPAPGDVVTRHTREDLFRGSYDTGNLPLEQIADYFLSWVYDGF